MKERIRVVTAWHPAETTFMLWLPLRTAEVTSYYIVLKQFNMIWCSAFPQLATVFLWGKRVGKCMF